MISSTGISPSLSSSSQIVALAGPCGLWQVDHGDIVESVVEVGYEGREGEDDDFLDPEEGQCVYLPT